MPKNANSLPPRRALFVVEYLKDLNATQAALRAGYASSDAGKEGHRLLADPDVQAAVAEAMAERQREVKVDASLVLRELLALATVDLAAAYADDGSLKPIHEIPPEVRKAIAGVEVFEEFEGVGAERKLVGHTRKVKFWDRPKAIELLGKHLALFTDKVELSGQLALANAILAARKRAQTGPDCPLA